ncbi:MAG: hypothetical protein FWC11_05505 [Firmicutes bacterium]|nr:hypothetical protein [Bacillota bacterium]
MFDSIHDFIADLSGTIWVFIALGIVAVVFIIFLILGLLTGEQKKIKSAAKIFLRNPHEKTAFMSAKEMPIKVRKQFKSAKMSGAKYSDVITYDACVTEPYQKSIISKIVVATILATVFSLVLIFAALLVVRPYPYDVSTAAGLLVVLALGFVFIIIAAIIAVLSKKGLNKTYENYVETLDKLASGELVSSSNEPVFESSAEPIREETPDIHSFPPSGPMKNQDTFNSPTSLDIELDSVGIMEDSPKSRFVEPQPMFSQDSQPGQFTPNEPVIIQQRTTTTHTAPPPVMPTNNIADERAAVDAEVRKAVAEAERARKAASAGTTTRTETTTMTIETVHNAPNNANQGKNSADDIIQRIDKISKEGAPLATMKEVAMLLQQERAKPENKSPEQQQKLNASLSTLLKAMSSAGKK